MLVSVIVIFSIFVVSVMLSCVLINKENNDTQGHCKGCPYSDLCREKDETDEN